MENTAPEMVSEIPQQSSSTHSPSNSDGIESRLLAVHARFQIAKKQMTSSVLRGANALSCTREQLKNAEKTIIEQKVQLKKAQKQVETVTGQNARISRELNEEKQKRFEEERKLEKYLEDFKQAQIELLEKELTLYTDGVQQYSNSEKTKLGELGQPKINEVEKMDQESTD